MAVVGAGPAGSTASYHLAEHDLEVLLLDQERFPRFKPCGGALSKKVKKFLPLDFDVLKGNEIYGAYFSFKGQETFRIEADNFIAKLIHREIFDQLLLEKAVRGGACFVGGERIIGVQKERNLMRLTSHRGEIYLARIVIGADGPRGITTRYMNPEHSEAMGVAIEEEMEIEPERNLRYVFLDFGRFPWGYGWVFPKEGLSSVGCGAILERKRIPLKGEFDQMKGGFGFLPEKANRRKGWLLPYFGEFSYRRAEEKMLLVGDAARFMDPFLGEGIYYALASATFAAESVLKFVEKRVSLRETYLSLVQREIMNELKHAARMAEFIYPKLWLGFKALKRSHQLGFLYMDVMSGLLPYSAFNKRLFHAIKEAGQQKLKRMLSK